jgi:hypothetical protein
MKKIAGIPCMCRLLYSVPPAPFLSAPLCSPCFQPLVVVFRVVMSRVGHSDVATKSARVVVILDVSSRVSVVL